MSTKKDMDDDWTAGNVAGWQDAQDGRPSVVFPTTVVGEWEDGYIAGYQAGREQSNVGTPQGVFTDDSADVYDQPVSAERRAQLSAMGERIRLARLAETPEGDYVVLPDPS